GGEPEGNKVGGEPEGNKVRKENAAGGGIYV
nr:hypothetical protein [Tanacetum cinerariifolium]